MKTVTESPKGSLSDIHIGIVARDDSVGEFPQDGKSRLGGIDALADQQGSEADMVRTESDQSDQSVTRHPGTCDCIGRISGVKKTGRARNVGIAI